MRTVDDLLNNKETVGVWAISPQDTVLSAIRLMSEKNVGALLVTDSTDVVGILTERDYTRKIILAGRTSATTAISEIMTREVVFVEPADSVANCMQLMTYRRFRHLPVLDQGILIGMVSIGDVVREFLDEKEFMINELVKYITGTPTLSSVA